MTRSLRCTQCAVLDQRIPLPTPGEYVELAVVARELVADGTLTLLEGNVPLDSLRRGQPLPKVDLCDDIHHLFACTSCGRRYMLFADTYHGGASWHPDRD